MRGFIVALAVVLTTACSMPVDRKPAEDAVARFHQRLDAGQFEAIYADASADFKAGTPQDRFVTLLSAIHGKLGATRSLAAKGWKQQVGTASAVLRLDYVTTYAGGTAEEKFAYRMQGDDVQLLEYGIRSTAIDLP